MLSLCRCVAVSRVLTVRSHHLRQLLAGDDSARAQTLRDKVEWAHFDARAFNVPDRALVAENVLWRQEVRPVTHGHVTRD